MGTEGELRPCIVNKKKALFHMWSSKTRIVEPSMMIGGHKGGVLKFTVGIIEYENGKVDEVFPNQVKFLDEKLKEFCFNN